MSLTTLDTFLDLVAICDCILYRTLLDVVVPSLAFEISEKLLQSIHNTGIHWNVWVQSSLENMPQKLVEAKMSTAKRFCRSLKRCVALIHLIQVTRPILTSDAPAFLCKDLEFFLQEVTNYDWSPNNELIEKDERDVTLEQARQLQNILNNCSSIKMLIDALDKMLLAIKGWKEEDKAATRNFVFNWVYMLSKISYILTENQSKYFTTFHLLSSLIQEYILLAVENQLDKEHEEHVYRRFKKHLRNSGNITSNITSKSQASCFRMNQTNQSDNNHLAKEKPRKLLDNAEFGESHTQNLYNTGLYPRACIYPRTTTSPQVMPSCKYASNTCHDSTTYDYHPSPLVIGGHTDERCISGLSQQFPTTFLTSTVSSRTDRIFTSSDALNIPHLEIYPFERNSCNVKADTSHESVSENHDYYQPVMSQPFQYRY